MRRGWGAVEARLDARDEDTSVGATWYLIGETTSYEFMMGTLMFKGEEWGESGRE